jgi:hypothetical protein
MRTLPTKGNHNMAHLMFYTPLGTVWGANVVDSSNNVSEPFPGSPLLLAPSYKGNPEPIVYVPDEHWRVVGWNDGPDVGRRMERNAGVVPEFFLISFGQHWSVRA